jgi:hypothetical protein
LLVTLQAPSLPGERRSALIISTGSYRDNRLPNLRAPAQDAADLSAVLRDPEYGGFEVSELLDKNKNDIEEALDHFLSARQPGETVVVYLSCHGLQTKQGELFFAAANTRIDAIPATALEARWLTDRLDECRARRQVVILDSCFSGAFFRTNKGNGGTGLEGWLNGTDPGETYRNGRGRAVLTASSATESSFEEDGTTAGEDPVRSVFSRALVEGLRTGNADADRDGLVSVLEAYEYASERVRNSGERQNPQIMYRGEGRIFLVRSPQGRQADPAGLLSDPRPEARIVAVDHMARCLDDPDPERVRVARGALERTAAEDIAQVSRVAQAHLARLVAYSVPTSAIEVSAAEPTATAEPAAAAKTAPVTADTADAVATKAPWAGNPARRWARLAAVITIVAVAGTIAAVSIKIDLSRRGSPPSCAAATQPGFHQVTVLSGATGTNLVICPVQVDHGQQPGLNVSLSGRIIGQPPSGQVLTVVSQPDQNSCATDGTPGSGGYYLVGLLHPAAATHGDWNVTSGDYYSGAQSIQRHIYFLLGPESAVQSFAQARDAYGETHDGDVGSWPGKPTLAGFRLLGMLTFTPVQPADRYCHN